MSDPERLPDIVGTTKRLPKGATVIYRHFGTDERYATAEHLRNVTFEREQQFLIGNDPELAIAVGADGVHFRRDAELTAPALWRERCPNWLITMAGVKDGSPYLGDLTALDGLIVSSVFDSHSPSAGKAVGVTALTHICETLNVPVFALGGVKANTAPKLIGSGAAGIAGVSGLLGR